MDILNNLKAFGISTKNKASYHAPELLMAAGTISGACSLIFTALGTIKAMDTIENHKAEITEVKEKLEGSEADKKTCQKEITRVYARTGLKLSGNYALAGGFAVISATCYFSAFGIMKKRYIALGAAYTALNSSFNLYRQRVIEDKGKDQDIYYMTGVKPKEITVVDEDGNKEKIKSFPTMPNGQIASPYAFKVGKYKENGERNNQWSDNLPYLLNLIKGQIDYYDDQLYLRSVKNHKGEIIKRGGVFLNELRDSCGEDYNKSGAVAGWRFGNGEPGSDGFISPILIPGTEIDPDTGREIPYVWVDPNVDGLIFDLIDQVEDHPFLPKLDRFNED